MIAKPNIPGANGGTIAYLAPEIPALSATFVYEELLAVERRDIQVIPVSVHRPARIADGQQPLAARTHYLYELRPISIVLLGVAELCSFRWHVYKAGKWLLSDVAEVGLGNIESWKLIFQFLASFRLAGILRRHRCKHLHIHFAHVPTQIGMYASALSNVPFSFTAHANDIFERGLLLKQKASRAVRLITISDYNRSYLASIGVRTGRLAVIRCGVSLIRPEAMVHRRKRNRQFRIGSLGRMVEKKGFDILIKAVALLSGRGFVVTLEIAGNGPLRDELEKLTQDLQITECTRFVGEIAHHRVAEWMLGLDCFVLACKKDKNGDMDGIPVVLMEAMSLSIPVISTRVSGVPELVVHERTGLLAEPDSIEDLQQNIERLIASENLCVDLACQAYEFVASEFSVSKNIDRLLQIMDLPSGEINRAHHCD